MQKYRWIFSQESKRRFGHSFTRLVNLLKMSGILQAPILWNLFLETFKSFQEKVAKKWLAWNEGRKDRANTKNAFGILIARVEGRLSTGKNPRLRSAHPSAVGVRMILIFLRWNFFSNWIFLLNESEDWKMKCTSLQQCNRQSPYRRAVRRF